MDIDFGKWKVLIRDVFMGIDTVDIFIYKILAHDKIGLLRVSGENELWDLEERHPTHEFTSATFRMPKSALKEMVQAVADMGILPDQVKDADSVLKVKDEHLQDVRKLLFDKLGVS